MIPPASQSAQVWDTGSTEARPRLAAAHRPIGHSLSPLYDLAAAVHTADIQPLEENENLRRDAAATSIFTSLSMLIGAFIASVSGALGGRLRDEHP